MKKFIEFIKKRHLIKKFFIFFSIVFIILLILFFSIPLPDVPVYPEEMVSYEILDRDGKVLRTVLSSSWATSSLVEMEDMSPHVINATVISEDKRFYSHFGIDPLATGRAIIQNIQAGAIVSGGSTITQQLAGLVYKVPQNSLYYKIIETLYALKLELKYSKKEILTIYLNRAPYGNETYGIEAASELYFGKPAEQLSLAESAFLSIIPRSPSVYDPYINFETTKKLQTSLLERMYETGKINSSEYKRAIEEPLLIIPVRDRFLAPHFCDFIQEKLKEENFNSISQIRTTIDYDIQKEVEKIIKKTVSSLEEKGVTNGSAIIVENSTGNIIAMVGSLDFFSPGGQVNACTALRQPGSALKPFIYGIALEKDYTPSDLIPDLEMALSTEKGLYIPKNYDNRFHGPVRLREALACSYNIPALKLTQKFGVETLLKKLHDAGFNSLKKSPSYYGLGLILGNGEVTLMELVKAYSALAYGGEVRDLNFIMTLKDEKGSLLYREAEKRGKTIFSQEVSFLLTDILSDNNARTPAFGEGSPINLPFPCAAKTGTSRSFRDNWTVGYTPRYTVGVWVGNFNADPMEGVSGISGAGPAFRDIMYLLHDEMGDMGNFSVPEDIESLSVCISSGMLPGKYCPARMEEYYLKGIRPGDVCNVHRMIRLDQRTGLPASEDCPEEFIFEKIYEIYPPEYYEWMVKNGMAFPEEILSSEENPSGRGKDILITSPAEGDTYRIDPVLRPEFQILYMKAIVSEGIKEIIWFIDGAGAGTTSYPFIYQWHLVPGEHTVKAEGNGISSEIIHFTVYDVKKKENQ